MVDISALSGPAGTIMMGECGGVESVASRRQQRLRREILERKAPQNDTMAESTLALDASTTLEKETNLVQTQDSLAQEKGTRAEANKQRKRGLREWWRRNRP